MNAKLLEDRVMVWDAEKGKELFEKEQAGKLLEDRLELSLIEACLLIEKKAIKVEGYDFEKFHAYCSEKDPRFGFRYVVYRDLRGRDLPVRTGFKFGCDFRVYAKGVKPLKRGPKDTKEHTKWIVFTVPEGMSFSFPELSRAVRLAHNIRANMLWAVVSGGKVGYYQVEFFKP